MSVPLKDQSTRDIEKALEAALLGLNGRTARVQIDALAWDESASSVKVSFTAWDKIDTDPFVGAL